MGSPVSKCGNCVYYNIGNRTFQFGRCTKVAGSISTYGMCDLYERIRNPFPPALNPQEFQQLEDWYWQKAAEKGLSPRAPYAGQTQGQLGGGTDVGVEQA
jgi:hypothetical protein